MSIFRQIRATRNVIIINISKRVTREVYYLVNFFRFYYLYLPTKKKKYIKLEEIFLVDSHKSNKTYNIYERENEWNIEKKIPIKQPELLRISSVAP